MSLNPYSRKAPIIADILFKVRKNLGTWEKLSIQGKKSFNDLLNLFGKYEKFGEMDKAYVELTKFQFGLAQTSKVL